MESKWIRISPDVEYSADFDFFCREQISVMGTRFKTIFYSRIEGRTFATVRRGDLPNHTEKAVLKSIHADICDLKYGGEFVD